MNESVILIILGMAVVTYIPRMVPLVFFNSEHIHPKVQNILKNVPFAILGALIFPGILTINEDIWFGIVGAAAAFIAAYFGANLIFVVLSSIAVLSVYAYFI
ncbi:AzlD domain-containing protein [Pseudalkalibacillus caeni]|uniref:AzlD domain-containing protein n=1 Tax=Exobacillus caeni TaxID=2574798 RepID=A0A5R9FEW3_9BACL|nr:AzlD domain-containing protein [Pseudalkalibacillus caeni]TLS38115.1 AzlD domain-containing protein [Pseudalkalibacillus caeni]